MNVEFLDLEEQENPMNGERLASASHLVELLDELRSSRQPFMCQLIADNGSMLTVGSASDGGCVQHSPSDGGSPYFMAVGSSEANMGEVEFAVGGTATPIDRRYCLPFKQVKNICSYFLQTGDRSPSVTWEEI
jgi:hypothetical protein